MTISPYRYHKSHEKLAIVIVDRAGREKSIRQFLLLHHPRIHLVQVHRRRNVEDQGLFMDKSNQTSTFPFFRLYERDPFTNKPVKNDTNYTELTLPGPIPTAQFNALPLHSTPCNSLIFPNQNVRSLGTTID